MVDNKHYDALMITIVGVIASVYHFGWELNKTLSKVNVIKVVKFNGETILCKVTDYLPLGSLFFLLFLVKGEHLHVQS